MKKAFRFFFSMKFAVGLLIILALACTIGSVVPQGNPATWYTQNYSQQISGAILLFGLDDLFHAWWFVLLAALLCIDLLGCNLIHMPRLLHRMKEGFTPEKARASFGRESLGQTPDPEKVFGALGFRPRKAQLEEAEEPKEALYAVKNKVGIWGPWLCHLGILIVILGFGLGQMAKKEYAVYGVPGQTKAIWEDGYELTIDDFDISYYEDGQVQQYTATLTVEDPATGRSQSGQASVNNPLNLFGMKFFQNSTGWAAHLDVEQGGKVIQQAVLCAGEYVPVEHLPDLIVLLSTIYPDYAFDEEARRPTTISPDPNNPAYLYQLYHQGEVIGMNVLTGEEVITVGDTVLRFYDPTPYTLIQVKRDPFTPLAAVGGLIVLLSLILSFYLRTSQLLAVKEADGTWQIYAYSRKGGEEFQERVRKACPAGPDAPA